MTSTMLCNLVMKYGPVAGRLLLALIFILSGLNKIGDWDGSLQHMTMKGIPYADILLGLSILIELGGGLLLALGLYARWAALAILLFLIPVTFIFHNFWAYAGMEQAMQKIQFLKNLAIMGGMLYVISYGSGNYSIRDPGCERRERERF
ncbi:MAG TPA: DoxX family protein [Gammaproteobacteria bacterium]|nr:DoxX family protein [Gammaproteobacteria bacterium]